MKTLLLLFALLIPLPAFGQVIIAPPPVQLPQLPPPQPGPDWSRFQMQPAPAPQVTQCYTLPNGSLQCITR